MSGARTGAAVALSAAVSFAAGCGFGESDDPPAKGSATPPSPPAAGAADERIIRGWSDDLRRGRIDAASRYFRLPSTAANGTPPVTLGVRDEVRSFNGSLPCGARLVRTVPRGRYTVGVFVLTERPGGACGSGTGHQAATAFLIQGGKIVEWLRVAVPPRARPPQPRAPAPEPGAPAPPGPRDPSETS